MQGRRWRFGIVAAAVLVGGSWTYRQTGPRLESGGAGISMPVVLGDTAHFGLHNTPSGGAVTITDVEVVGDVDGIDVEYSVVGSLANRFGTNRGDLEAQGYQVQPADGAVLRPGDDSPYLVVSFTPNRLGTWRFFWVEVTYGSGLRRRTTRLMYGFCVTAVPDQAALTSATEPCEPEA